MPDLLRSIQAEQAAAGSRFKAWFEPEWNLGAQVGMSVPTRHTAP
jgi:hypothetical protein